MSECNNKCRNCTNWECRCQDCACLIADDNGIWYCEDFDCPCEEVIICNNYE